MTDPRNIIVTEICGFDCRVNATAQDVADAVMRELTRHGLAIVSLEPTEAEVEAAWGAAKSSIVPNIYVSPQPWMGTLRSWFYRGIEYASFEAAKDAQQKEIMRAALIAARKATSL